MIVTFKSVERQNYSFFLFYFIFKLYNIVLVLAELFLSKS